MMVEALRMIADRLTDATYGVNAMLASTPLDSGDTVPASIATGSILDATRDGNVARGRLPASLPGIAVTVREATGLENYPMAADAEATLTVVIRFGLDKNQTEQGARDTSYYLRTIVRVLKAFHLADASARTRNNIYLQSCETMQLVPLWQDLDDSIVTGAVVVTYHVRDYTPT